MAKGKISKMAANKLAVTATVTSSAAVHGPEVVDALHALLFPGGPHRADATGKFLTALSEHLDRAALQVQEADLAHASELLDDEAPRQRRDEAQARLTETLLGQRAAFEGMYGAAVCRTYGLSDALPTLPPELMQRARSIAKQLRGQPLTGKSRLPGVALKPSLLADELDKDIEAFAAALAEVQREAREAQLTLERKAAAGTAWQNAYQGVTNVFYGLYLLAGRRDLADRIEPTARRRAGLPEPEDTDDKDEEGGGVRPEPEPPPAPVGD